VKVLSRLANARRGSSNVVDGRVEATESTNQQRKIEQKIVINTRTQVRYPTNIRQGWILAALNILPNACHLLLSSVCVLLCLFLSCSLLSLFPTTHPFPSTTMNKAAVFVLLAVAVFALVAVATARGPTRIPAEYLADLEVCATRFALVST
jgi:hypothetical protein